MTLSAKNQEREREAEKERTLFEPNISHPLDGIIIPSPPLPPSSSFSHIDASSSFLSFQRRCCVPKNSPRRRRLSLRGFE